MNRRLLIFLIAMTINTGYLFAQRVTMLVTLHVKPEKREELKAALIKDKWGAVAEPGNISMTFFVNRDNPNIFYLFERWVSQEALDSHFKQPYTLFALEISKTALATPMEITKLTDIDPLPKDQIKTPLTTDSPVDLICIFSIKPGMGQTFINQFRKSIVNSRPEPGNINFFFHTVVGDTSTYVLYERWRSEAALQSHFQQPYTKELFDMFKITLPQPAENYLHYVKEIK